MKSEPDEIRTAARVILIDPDNRILLLGARDPADQRLIWFVPGGGVEAGETLVEAATRELQEEVPQAGTVELIGPVWRRHHDFTWGARWIIQTEFFFVGRLAATIDPTTIDVGGAEAAFFAGARWASVEDLAAWPMTEIMAPRRLPQLMVALLAGDYPESPIDAGV